MNNPHPHDLVIGSDRSDAKADLHLIDTRTGKSQSETIAPSPEDLHEWLAHLCQQYPQSSVGICLEQPAANLVLLQKLQKSRLETIKKFYRDHGSHSPKLLERRLELIERAVALTEEVSILESLTARVQLICGQLQILGKAFEEFDERIEEPFKEHPDRPTSAPRLLASLGSQRERCERASPVRSWNTWTASSWANPPRKPCSKNQNNPCPITSATEVSDRRRQER